MIDHYNCICIRRNFRKKLSPNLYTSKTTITSKKIKSKYLPVQNGRKIADFDFALKCQYTIVLWELEVEISMGVLTSTVIIQNTNLSDKNVCLQAVNAYFRLRYSWFFLLVEKAQTNRYTDGFQIMGSDKNKQTKTNKQTNKTKNKNKNKKRFSIYWHVGREHI